MKKSLPDEFVPRLVCPRCRRPQRVCFCAELPSIETKTRVLLLQHPRERDMAIGTAHMASLCLPRSELHVGLSFEGSPALASALSDPARPAVLLYPGEGARDVRTDPPPGPVTLVVVDGTWWQAKKLVRVNPTLASLPRYAFTPPRPSEYRIRREPRETYVSTIEALVHVLGALEGDPARFEALLAPFRAMIDRQIHFATNVHGYRERHLRHLHEPPRPRIPAGLRPLLGRRGSIVCVSAEANAWPYRERDLRTPHRDELVHWVAYRLGSGDTLDVVVAPRAPLAPSTPTHVGLDRETLEAGVAPEELFRRWRAFLQPDDLVCTWGVYATDVLAKAGGEGAFVTPAIDVRVIARNAGRGPVGSMASFLATRGITDEPPPIARGRAGRRAALLARVVHELCDACESYAPAISARPSKSAAP